MNGLKRFLVENKAVLGLFFMLLVAGVVAIYFALQYSRTRKQVDHLASLQEQKKVEVGSVEGKDVIKRIGEVFILPMGEEPAIITVTNAKKLREDKPFFSLAKDNDILLVYQKAGKAILYRPDVGKIVNVEHVLIEEESSLELKEGEEPLKVEIRNGSKQKGLAGEYSKKLAEKDIFEILEPKDASKDDYSEHIVVSLMGDNEKKSTMLRALSKEFGVDVVDKLPEGEKPTEAEAVVIVVVK